MKRKTADTLDRGIVVKFLGERWVVIEVNRSPQCGRMQISLVRSWNKVESDGVFGLNALVASEYSFDCV